MNVPCEWVHLLDRDLDCNLDLDPDNFAPYKRVTGYIFDLQAQIPYSADIIDYSSTV